MEPTYGDVVNKLSGRIDGVKKKYTDQYEMDWELIFIDAMLVCTAAVIQALFVIVMAIRGLKKDG